MPNPETSQHTPEQTEPTNSDITTEQEEREDELFSQLQLKLEQVGYVYENPDSVTFRQVLLDAKEFSNKIVSQENSLNEEKAEAHREIDQVLSELKRILDEVDAESIEYTESFDKKLDFSVIKETESKEAESNLVQKVNNFVYDNGNFYFEFNVSPAPGSSSRSDMENYEKIYRVNENGEFSTFEKPSWEEQSDVLEHWWVIDGNFFIETNPEGGGLIRINEDEEMNVDRTSKEAVFEDSVQKMISYNGRPIIKPTDQQRLLEVKDSGETEEFYGDLIDYGSYDDYSHHIKFVLKGDRLFARNTTDQEVDEYDLKRGKKVESYDVDFSMKKDDKLFVQDSSEVRVDKAYSIKNAKTGEEIFSKHLETPPKCALFKDKILALALDLGGKKLYAIDTETGDTVKHSDVTNFEVVNDNFVLLVKLDRLSGEKTLEVLGKGSVGSIKTDYEISTFHSGAMIAEYEEQEEEIEINFKEFSRGLKIE